MTPDTTRLLLDMNAALTASVQHPSPETARAFEAARMAYNAAFMRELLCLTLPHVNQPTKGT